MSPEILKPQVVEVGKAVIINETGQVLLVQRAADDSWCPLYWEIPGGKGDPGESIEKVLIRETYEETGLLVEPVLELHFEEMLMTEGHRKGNLYRIRSFVCRATGNLLLSPEHNDHTWAEIEKALSFNLTSPTRNALEKLAASPQNPH